MKESTQKNPSPKIGLIVDDDPSIRLTLRATLLKNGYQTLEAANGIEALEIFDSQDPDFVLLDVMMPKMGGFETCEKLRQRKNGRFVPIVFMTGLDDTESVRKAYEVGATDFVSKPINLQLFAYRVEFVLRATQVAGELRESESRVRNAQKIAKLGHIEWDQNLNVIHCSIGVKDIVQLCKEASISDISTFLDWVHPNDRDAAEKAIRDSITAKDTHVMEYRIVRESGEVRHVVQIGDTESLKSSGQSTVITLQDVTERKETEKKIHTLAFYDELTGLPNRTLLIDHMNKFLESAVRYKRKVVVMALGIDNFKQISDTLDNEALNVLVKSIANRINSCVRRSDLLSRKTPIFDSSVAETDANTTAKLRNDEYIVVLPEVESLESAQIFVHRLSDKLSDPFRINDANIYITASVGVSTFPEDGGDANELIKNSEVAMGFARQSGTGKHRFFKQSHNKEITRTFSLQQDLRKTLDVGDLLVHYQPRYCIKEKRVIGVEALLRWNHFEYGYIPPGEFVGIAEDSGIIGSLCEFVIDTSCDDIEVLNKKLQEDLTVGINLSSRQFQEPRGSLRVVEALQRSRLTLDKVVLELTEGTIIENFAAGMKDMIRFREMGCNLAIDDFGTGYSSLAYLGRLPFDILKIDKSFIDHIETHSEYKSIVKGIIQLGHSIGMTVVAEGVESIGQKEILETEGCDEIQGYLIGKALPLSDLEKLIVDTRDDNSNSLDDDVRMFGS